MTHYVNSLCVGCKDMACVSVCPVSAFGDIGHMLVIDPETCIDCAICVTECPVSAILDDSDPNPFIAFNAQQYPTSKHLL